MSKHTTNSQLKVEGKMSKKGADRAGHIQAITNMLLVFGFITVSIILALK